jgi:enoyl-CoA hydratase
MAVELSIEQGLAHLHLNRPKALNALSFGILQDLNNTLAQIEQAIEQQQVRGLVITGEGEKSFCAGADIPELLGRTLLQQHEGARLGQEVFNRLAALRVPSVAVIHGYAFGGGLELALSCTFRLATARAKMGLPEIKLGLIPGYGGTQRLPRLIGEGRALDIILSGRTVDAIEAERIGLVTRLVEEGNPYTLGTDFLAPYLKHGLLALDMARQAISRGVQTTLEQGLKIERDLSTLIFQTADANEGMTAFTEKRPAIFKDH